MKIKSVVVKSYHIGGLRSECEGITHVKALPFLSVVQSTEGYYDITLDNGPRYQTKNGGAFIAPSVAMQTITHHENPESGFMRARWVFLDIVMNDTERIDSMFKFPVLIPEKYKEELNAIFDELEKARGVCRELSAIYRMVDVLLKVASKKEDYDKLTEDIISYVCAHFAEQICYAEFAKQMNISQSSLFRKFQSVFGKTPSHYINEFRVFRAASLLENGELSIKEVAAAVGIRDEFYFSKLFKQIMEESPLAYKRKLHEKMPRD